MKKISLVALALFMSACAQPGKVGDECSENADCAEGLECHLHEDGHEGEEEEAHGVCEEEHGEEEHSDEEGGEEGGEV